MVVRLAYKVAEQKGNGALLEHIVQELQGQTHIRAAGLACMHGFWLQGYQLADDTQDMRLSFLRRNKLFYLIAEKNDADFIIVLNS